MPIHVRELLKKHLPHTLSDRFSYLSSKESLQSIGWGQLDPEKDESYSNTDPIITNKPFSWEEYPQDSVEIEQRHPIHDGRPFHTEIDEYDWVDDVDCGGWSEPVKEDSTGEESSDSGKKIVTETAAFYKPFHFYDDWGIYIKEAPILRLKRIFARDIEQWLYAFCHWNSSQEIALTNIVNDLSLRLATLRYYAHEVFHHKVEAFSTRCESVRETPVYVLGFHYTHRNTSGYWEEPLAECHMLKEIDNPSCHTWNIFHEAIKPFVIPATNVETCAPLLRRRIVNRSMRLVKRNTPYPYNQAPQIYPTWKKDWQRFQQDVLRSIGFQANALELMSNMDSSYRYKNSKGFWIVVPKGGRPPRWMQVLSQF